MFDTFMGIPIHVLVIHAVVVLGPVAGIFALAYAARPAWRRILRWPLATLGVIAGVAGFVAAESGEQLEQRLRSAGVGGETLTLIEEHADAGDLAKLACLIFLVVTLVAAFVTLKPGQSGVLTTVTAIVLALSALGVMATVTLAGHAGAKAVWSQTVTGTNASGG